jgi:hypothetical protein
MDCHSVEEYFANTQKLIGIDVNEISDEMQINSQDESSDFDLRQETKNQIPVCFLLANSQQMNRFKNRKRYQIKI